VQVAVPVLSHPPAGVRGEEHATLCSRPGECGCGCGCGCGLGVGVSVGFKWANRNLIYCFFESTAQQLLWTGALWVVSSQDQTGLHLKPSLRCSLYPLHPTASVSSSSPSSPPSTLRKLLHTAALPPFASKGAGRGPHLPVRHGLLSGRAVRGRRAAFKHGHRHNAAHPHRGNHHRRRAHGPGGCRGCAGMGEGSRVLGSGGGPSS